jgi:dihydrodipicolinate synthase/N-acetylneuraminate lyase
MERPVLYRKKKVKVVVFNSTMSDDSTHTHRERDQCSQRTKGASNNSFSSIVHKSQQNQRIPYCLSNAMPIPRVEH